MQEGDSFKMISLEWVANDLFGGLIDPLKEMF
jgi:hypothetical protein